MKRPIFKHPRQCPPKTNQNDELKKMLFLNSPKLELLCHQHGAS